MRAATKFLSLFTLTSLPAAFAADTQYLDLGKTAELAQLFSYPNCQQHCATPRQDLRQTIAGWLTQNLRHDGYDTASVSLHQSRHRHLIAKLENAPTDYPALISQYLQTGKLALQEAKAIKAEGKWQSDWRFFLTLGMPLRNHLTVQLLHFPPDTVLNDTQNYLTAATTVRWATLLNLNGMDPRQNALYQTIADIAPIAAPANAGTTLEGLYDRFNPYSKALLEQWTQAQPGGNKVRPVVALGGPVRDWLARNWQTGPLQVGDLRFLDFGRSKQVPVLIGNHPSAIWYAKTEQDGLTIMQQDLTISCWQNAMARGASDARQALTDCQQSWQNSKQVCSLYFTTVKNQSMAEANRRCQA